MRGMSPLEPVRFTGGNASFKVTEGGDQMYTGCLGAVDQRRR